MVEQVEELAAELETESLMRRQRVEVLDQASVNVPQVWPAIGSLAGVAIVPQRWQCEVTGVEPGYTGEELPWSPCRAGSRSAPAAELAGGANVIRTVNVVAGLRLVFPSQDGQR